eukprot:TCALIF_10239-PA protein Name:"Protein of unknown function" AED:0.39 eAED:0.39 QI:0/0.33/0.25/0.5/1/1/4/0/437
MAILSLTSHLRFRGPETSLLSASTCSDQTASWCVHSQPPLSPNTTSQSAGPFSPDLSPLSPLKPRVRLTSGCHSAPSQPPGPHSPPTGLNRTRRTQNETTSEDQTTPPTGQRRLVRKKSCIDAFEVSSELAGLAQLRVNPVQAESGRKRGKPMLLDFQDSPGSEPQPAKIPKLLAMNEPPLTNHTSPKSPDSDTHDASFESCESGSLSVTSANKENQPQAPPPPEAGALKFSTPTQNGPELARNVRFIMSPKTPIELSQLDEAVNKFGLSFSGLMDWRTSSLAPLPTESPAHRRWPPLLNDTPIETPLKAHTPFRTPKSLKKSTGSIMRERILECGIGLLPGLGNGEVPARSDEPCHHRGNREIPLDGADQEAAHLRRAGNLRHGCLSHLANGFLQSNRINMGSNLDEKWAFKAQSYVVYVEQGEPQISQTSKNGVR